MKFIFWIKRILFILAALSAVGASISIIAVPITMHEISSGPTPGSQTGAETFTRVSWYQAQGIWGIVVVVTFAFIYVVIGLLAWMDYLPGLAIFSFLALLFTLLAGLSIGGAYAPALLGTIMGWFLIGAEKILSIRARAQPRADDRRV